MDARAPVAVLVAALCLAGPGFGQTVGLSKSEIAAVEAAVKSRLRDPESARFGRMETGKVGPKSILVCGWVNAKNGYGGYDGFGPFFGYLQQQKPPVFEAKNITRGDLGYSFVSRTCRGEGVILPPTP